MRFWEKSFPVRVAGTCPDKIVDSPFPIPGSAHGQAGKGWEQPGEGKVSLLWQEWDEMSFKVLPSKL